MRNKGLVIVIVLLLVWNVVLTYQVFVVKPTITRNETETINKTTTAFETNITEVVGETIQQVVNITNQAAGITQSVGSGVVIKKEGNTLFIITNNHVIENAQRLIVAFNNGESIDAKVVGADAYSDLALLSLTADFELEPIAIGNSNNTKVGETVVAIGSPLGQQFFGSVTMGIISGKERLIEVDLDNNGSADWDMLLLQTDAAINPGNSGGALVNMAGELIGINTLKFADQTVEGMGFAVPVNEIVSVVDSFQAYGKINRPFIGITAISVSELDNFSKQQYGILPEVTKGVLILEVQPGSAAAQAKLLKYDLITHFDGEEITSFKDFRKLLYTKQPGDKIVLTIDRVGMVEDITVTLK